VGSFDSEKRPRTQFEGTNFESVVSFEAVKIGDDILFDKASIDEIAIDPTKVVEPVTLYFEESVIDSGTIEFDGSDSGNQCLVDFTKTRLGDVNLLSEAQHTGVFDQCRIQNTEFDGFNFIPHLQELRALRWEIHHTDSGETKKSYLTEKKEKLGEYLPILIPWFRDEPSLRHLREHFQTLQTTYQYAKTGANVTGQSEPASEFFQREMRYQTRNHLCEALSAGKPLRKRVVPFVKSLFTSLFGALSKYGESGTRVIASSGVIVLGFFLIYLSLPDAGAGKFQKFVFSLGSFAAFLTGDIGQNAAGWTALLASFEGFVGALMSALLLFTLTRSIHR
jgi:hypothetical protein